MKILIPTIGTRGDIQPYIALSIGLKAAGHTPTIASHPFLRDLVESYDISFAPIGPDIDIGLETAAIRGKSPNWIQGLMRVMKFSFSMLEQAHPDLLALARDTDLIIVSHTSAGSIEADMLHIPMCSVTLMPQAIPVDDPDQSFFKRLINKVVGAGFGLIMTRPMNQIRKRLGLKPMGKNGITSPFLNLIPLSPSVFPPDLRWEPRHQMTGYWFAPSPENFSPPEKLTQFLENGPAPILFTLGAMAISGEDATSAARITLTAINNAGVRAIIQGWDEPLKSLPLSENIFHAGPLPHEWLLSRCRAVVHHGGFGTTSAGLRAGIPGMAIPHIIDQFIWGKTLHDLGVGPEPIARTKLSVENLSQALQQLNNNEGMHSTAAEIGRKIRAENGVENAVKLIINTFDHGSQDK